MATLWPSPVPWSRQKTESTLDCSFPSAHFRCCPFLSPLVRVLLPGERESGKFPMVTRNPSELFSCVEITRTKLKQTNKRTEISHQKAPTLYSVQSELQDNPPSKYPGFVPTPPSKLPPHQWSVPDEAGWGTQRNWTLEPRECNMNRINGTYLVLYVITVRFNWILSMYFSYAKDVTWIISFYPGNNLMSSFSFYRQ